METASLDSKFLSKVYPENGDDGRHYDYICDDEHYEKMIIYIYTYFNDNDLVGWVGLGDYWKWTIEFYPQFEIFLPLKSLSFQFYVAKKPFRIIEYLQKKLNMGLIPPTFKEC